MSREKLALVLSTMLIALSIWNIGKVDKLSQMINSELYAAEHSVEAGAWNEAEASINKALKIWMNAENYTHIFIRHPEIDSCTDSFYAVCEAVLAENTEELPARLQALRYHLEGIAKMEHISLGNIF